jgi:hypothetical protein
MGSEQEIKDAGQGLWKARKREEAVSVRMDTGTLQ